MIQGIPDGRNEAGFVAAAQGATPFNVVEDAWVMGVPDGRGEAWYVAAAQGATPFYSVEDGSMLHYQAGVEEELLGEGGLNASDGFPVGWAEVGSECKAYLEEQVVCEDLGKRTCNIGVMLYLVEAGLDVIDVDDDVVSGVRNP